MQQQEYSAEAGLHGSIILPLVVRPVGHLETEAGLWEEEGDCSDLCGDVHQLVLGDRVEYRQVLHSVARQPLHGDGQLAGVLQNFKTSKYIIPSCRSIYVRTGHLQVNVGVCPKPVDTGQLDIPHEIPGKEKLVEPAAPPATSGSSNHQWLLQPLVAPPAHLAYSLESGSPYPSPCMGRAEAASPPP